MSLQDRAAPARRRRWLFRGAAVASALTVIACGFFWRPIAARAVTWLALREIERYHEQHPQVIPDGGMDQGLLEAMRTYERWWRLDLLDRAWLVEKWPATAVGREAASHWVLAALAVIARLSGPSEREQDEAAIQAEVAAWFDAVLPAARSREALVEALTGDWTLLSGPGDASAGLPKRWLCLALLGIDADVESLQLDEELDEDCRRWESICLAAVRESHWRAFVRDASHEREKVRAGALLLLFRHPDRTVHLTLATRGLADPSPWVRLAAAGTLALRGDPAGADRLLEGLRHERWEVRWWSLMGLRALEDPRLPGRLAEAAKVETDEWLKSTMEKLAEKLAEAATR